MVERKPPRLNAAAICKAVAEYDLSAHIVLRPDGVTEIDITGKTAASPKPEANSNGSDAAAPIETADELRKLI